MKKTAIAVAVAAVLAAPVAMADVTVYGQARVSIDSVDTKSDTIDGLYVSDRASRFGLKGSEDLGDGLKAVFGMEWGVSLDNSATAAGRAVTGLAGNSTDLGVRNRFVGLSGGFGTALAGTHDTPYKMVGSADVFGDTAADSQANTSGIIGRNGFDNRAGNAVAYVSPSLGGWTIMAAGVAGEGGNGNANGLTDILSLGAKGAIGPVKVGVAYESAGKKVGGGTENKTAIKGDVKYAMGDLGLGFTYESSSACAGAITAACNSSDKDIGMLLSATYAMGNNVLAAQYGKFDAKVDAGDLTRMTVGLVHNFSKTTNAYVAYSTDDSKTDANDLTAITAGLNVSF